MLDALHQYISKWEELHCILILWIKTEFVDNLVFYNFLQYYNTYLKILIIVLCV